MFGTGYHEKSELGIEKRAAIQAAKELCYGKEVIHKLKEAETSFQISRIMTNARKERMK